MEKRKERREYRKENQVYFSKPFYLIAKDSPWIFIPNNYLKSPSSLGVHKPLILYSLLICCLSGAKKMISAGVFLR